MGFPMPEPSPKKPRCSRIALEYSEESLVSQTQSRTGIAMSAQISESKPTIGWREWIRLDQLGIPGIKAKIDTGARSSSLHTHDYELFERDGEQWVKFHLHPLVKNEKIERTCEAPVLRFEDVKDSGGHLERRPFIRTMVTLGEVEWEIDLNLSNREMMKFRMLLGREALAPFLIDPTQSYLRSRSLREEYQNEH